MSTGKHFLISTRSRIAGLLAAAANKVGGLQSVDEPTDTPMNIDNFNPEGKAVVIDMSPGRLSFKVMAGGKIDENVGKYVQEQVKSVLDALHENYRDEVKYGIHTFMDPYEARYAICLDREYLSGEDFTRAVLHEVSAFALDYGYDVHVIGAYRMKKFIVPKQYIAIPAGSEGSSVSAQGVDPRQDLA